MSMLFDSVTGKYMKVISKSNGKTIVSGKIISEKNTINGIIDMQLVSCDEKFFFKMNGTKNYSIVISNDLCETMKFNANDFPYLNIKHWSTAILNYLDESIDIYKENLYSELDPEVVDLCEALNSIHGIHTISSCSGHGKREAFVNISISKLESLLFLLKILSIDIFRFSFVLTSDKTLMYSNECRYPMLKLRTTCIGE